MTIISSGHGKDESLQLYIRKLIKQAGIAPKDLNPALAKFRAFVERDESLRTLSSQMFEEVPLKPPYNTAPAGSKSQVRDFKHLLQLLNYIMMHAPEWDNDANRGDFAAFPINALLHWPLGTPSGGSFFLRTDVNQHLAKILNVWAEYLTSEDSTSVLNDGPRGWFGTDAMEALTTSGNVGKTHYSFDQLYVCDSATLHHGFASWDDFFLRRFQPGIRSVITPEGGPEPTAVIVTACEATPVRIVRNVQAREAFWLKGQPYSILDMLANDELASDFVGGTVYQAFLSALSYHRWHSPVSGTVAKTYIVPGAPYSENLYQDFAYDDPTIPNFSQSYLAEVSTRGLIFIHADNPNIGLMCIVFIGIAEVSTCEFTVKPGQNVTKGDEIGTFHYGGSSYCMIFRKDVQLLFESLEMNPKYNTPVLSTLAVVQNQANGI